MHAQVQTSTGFGHKGTVGSPCQGAGGCLDQGCLRSRAKASRGSRDRNRDRSKPGKVAFGKASALVQCAHAQSSRFRFPAAGRILCEWGRPAVTCCLEGASELSHLYRKATMRKVDSFVNPESRVETIISPKVRKAVLLVSHLQSCLGPASLLEN